MSDENPDVKKREFHSENWRWNDSPEIIPFDKITTGDSNIDYGSTGPVALEKHFSGDEFVREVPRPDDYAVVYQGSSAVHRVEGSGCFEKAKDWIKSQQSWPADARWKRTSPRNEPDDEGRSVVDCWVTSEGKTGYSAHWCRPVSAKPYSGPMGKGTYLDGQLLSIDDLESME